MSKKAVRESEFAIEIDAKRGQWPNLQAIWGRDGSGKTVLIMIADGNEREVVVGDGTHIGIIGLTKKKAKRLADFIYRTIDEVPDAE